MAKLSNRLRYQLNQMCQTILILFKVFNKKKPLSSKANHQLLPSKPSQRDIDHKQEMPISFSNFQSRTLRPVQIDLQMFLNTKQMKMSRTFLDIFICFVSKKSSLSDWKLQIQQQKAAQKQKSLREKKGYSDTAERKRKAMNVAVIRNFCFHVDAGKE